MAKADPRDTLKTFFGEKAATLLARSPNADIFQNALKAVEEERAEELEKVAADKITSRPRTIPPKRGTKTPKPTARTMTTKSPHLARPTPTAQPWGGVAVRKN